MKDISQQITDKDSQRMKDNIFLLMEGEKGLKPEATLILSRMQPEFCGCSFQNKTLTVAFPVLEEELNRSRNMMGGMIATAFDAVFGLLVYAIDGELMPPTINLNINYVRPVPEGDRLILTVRIDSYGRKIVHLSGTGVSESSGNTVSTATTIILSPAMMR